MQVSKIELDVAKAKELYRTYKDHRHYSTPVDDEIRRAYREISKGNVVIQALASIKAAGLNDQGLPNLAIARADLPFTWGSVEADGSALFRSEAQRRVWRREGPEHDCATRFTFPKGTFNSGGVRRAGKATLPLIPVHLRPRQSIEKYAILWEAEWTPTPPIDPYLLRRIGKADLWIVCAAWDLTEVERAALATRVSVS